jgi:hypothetical protein
MNPFCIESGTIEGSAFCAASSEPCTDENLSECFEDDGGIYEVHFCEDGVWKFRERCVEYDTSSSEFEGTSCVEFSDGGADCQP